MPSRTHQKIVDREIAKFRKRRMLVFPEAHVGQYIFDILALDAPNKQIEIVEVDDAATTSQEKILFAEKFAKIRIFRPEADKQIKVNEVAEKVGTALGDTVRLKILKALFSEQMTYCELKTAVEIRDIGRFAYHLNTLLKTGTVISKEGTYQLTELGNKLEEFLQGL